MTSLIGPRAQIRSTLIFRPAYNTEGTKKNRILSTSLATVISLDCNVSCQKHFAIKDSDFKNRFC